MISSVLTKHHLNSDHVSAWCWQKISAGFTKCQNRVDHFIRTGLTILSDWVDHFVGKEVTKCHNGSDRMVNPVWQNGQLGLTEWSTWSDGMVSIKPIFACVRLIKCQPVKFPNLHMREFFFSINGIVGKDIGKLHLDKFK